MSVCNGDEHKLITVNKHYGNDVMIIILILLVSLCIFRIWYYFVGDLSMT